MLNDVELGSTLREARESKGLTQDQVARHLGLPRSAISLIESGNRQLSALELKAWAAFTGFTPDQLLRQPKDTEDWISEPCTCLHCNNSFVSVHPKAYPSPASNWIECPRCGFRNYPVGKYPEPIYVILSHKYNLTSLTVNRRVDRLILAGILNEALTMTSLSNLEYCDPADCNLKVALTVLTDPADTANY